MKKFVFILVIIFAGAIAVSCAVTPLSAPTAEPTAVVLPTAPRDTATPLPVTAVPMPEATPELLPTPEPTPSPEPMPALTSAEGWLMRREFILSPGGPQVVVEVYKIAEKIDENNGLLKMYIEGVFLQEIIVSTDMFFYIQTTAGPDEFSDFFAAEDMDFDMYTDFRVLAGFGVSDMYYTYLLWDEDEGQFIQRDSYKRLDAYPVFDANFGQIRCSSRDGWGHYIYTTYQVIEGEAYPVLVREDKPDDAVINIESAVYSIDDNGERTLIRSWSAPIASPES